MHTEIKTDGKTFVIPKSLRSKMLFIGPMLEGGRRFLKNGSFSCQSSIHNRRIIEEHVQGVVFIATDKDQASSAPKRALGTVFTTPWPNFEHQEEAFNKFKDRRCFALFAEMGTGKTKIAIDIMNRHFTLGRIDAVIILAKKGVHTQWIEGEENEFGEMEESPIKKYTQTDIKFIGQAWTGKKIDEKLLHHNEKLKWFSLNFDSIIFPKAMAELTKFLEEHKGRLGFIADESHHLKSHNAKRSVAAQWVAESCEIKGIMTGTPIAKNLVDEWSQFLVLDEDIIGHRYLTTFRNEYCVMGGFEGRSVVGAKNLDRFKQITGPHCFRILKSDCMDLPEKQYHRIDFKLSKEQLDAIMEIKLTSAYTRADGVEIYYEQAVTVLAKIQEISNGFLFDRTDPDNPYLQMFPNPRMKALNEFREGNEQKVIIWARYRMDIQLLKKELGEQAVLYYGEVKDADRKISKARFLSQNEGVNYLIATPASMGEGIDGLQKVCTTAIYYSNNFNSLQRWQSEDRIHRIGMGGSADYVDLVAKGCVDYSLLANLKAKKDFSTMVLDMTSEMNIRHRPLEISEPDEFEASEPVEAPIKVDAAKWERL